MHRHLDSNATPESFMEEIFRKKKNKRKSKNRVSLNINSNNYNKVQHNDAEP